ncbi:hypothetical protein, partial [Lysinibacillus fusiformis]|uniref:hypothetical protein n=1 Tax=Lysinibacillus fusiformis TaxID=28031 RepID=UPI0020BDB342
MWKIVTLVILTLMLVACGNEKESETDTTYGTHLVEEDDNITFYEEPVEEMKRYNDDVNDNESKLDDTQSVQADLDTVPVLGAFNT